MVAAIYQGFIKDEAGNIIEGASVEVRDQDTNALVDLWSNRATTSTKTNPTTTDANGYFFFYRTAGRYKITVTSATYSATFNNVPIGTAQEYDTGSTTGLIPTVDDLATVAVSGSYNDLTNKPTLGTMAALNTGTASGEFRTNTQNDARFFQIANNLSEGTASAIRTNIQLGSSDVVTFGTVAAATIDTGQGAVECYAMDQAVRTTDAVTFAQINGDNIRIDGNTISSTDTNGNITIDPNGTGTVELVGGTNVTGAITATTGVTVASSQDVLANVKQDTFTATCTCTTSGTITLTTGQEKLRYQRIGKEVLVSGLLTVDSVSSPTGGLRITMPFTVANLADLSDYSVGMCFINGSVSKNAGDFAVFTAGLANVLYIYRLDASSTVDDCASQIQAGTTIYLQLSFPVA